MGGNQVKNMKTKFKTMENATRNYFTIFPKNASQFKDEKEVSVEDHGPLGAKGIYSVTRI